MAKQGGLGRGLGALIVNTDDAANERAPAAMVKANTVNPNTVDRAAQEDGSGIRDVDVRQIAPNPHQPRTFFDQDALAELAASIGEHGIIQPLIVTLSDDAQAEQRYWLVAGERRWRAAQLANLSTVPVIVREASTSQLMEWALVENIQRADLNALEEAIAYQALMGELSLTQAEVADRVGKSRSAVANTVRLLQLPREAQDALVADEISAGHARALLGLSDKQLMLSTLEKILAQELNVRQTEALIKRLLESEEVDPLLPEQDAPQQDVHVAHLEDRFRLALNTRVSLNRQSDGSGKLVIHFYNDDDLDNIYQHIAGGENEV